MTRLLRTDHAPLLLVLAYAIVDNAVIEALHRWIFVGPAPVWHAIQRYGWPAQAAYHVETGLVLGWPAMLAWASWATFACPQKASGPESRSSEPSVSPQYASSLSPATDAAQVSRRGSGQKMRRESIAVKAREVLFGAWLIAAGGLAACFPLPKGMTAPALHAIELAFVAAALAALPAGWRSRAIVTPQGRALGLLVVVELVVGVLGAWGTGAGVFSRETWDHLSRLPYCLGWLALVVLLARR